MNIHIISFQFGGWHLPNLLGNNSPGLFFDFAKASQVQNKRGRWDEVFFNKMLILPWLRAPGVLIFISQQLLK